MVLMVLGDCVEATELLPWTRPTLVLVLDSATDVDCPALGVGAAMLVVRLLGLAAVVLTGASYVDDVSADGDDAGGSLLNADVVEGSVVSGSLLLTDDEVVVVLAEPPTGPRAAVVEEVFAAGGVDAAGVLDVDVEPLAISFRRGTAARSCNPHLFPARQWSTLT